MERRVCCDGERSAMQLWEGLSSIWVHGGGRRGGGQVSRCQGVKSVHVPVATGTSAGGSRDHDPDTCAGCWR